MMRKTLACLDKLVIVESPNKVIKIEGLLSDPQCIPDWSFKRDVLSATGSGPQKAYATATTGHFMSLTEINWTPRGGSGGTDYGFEAGRSGRGAVADADSLPRNGTLSRYSLEWEVLPGRKVAETLQRYFEKIGDDLTEIILATDPDREGELIAVHSIKLIQSLYPNLNVPFSRAYMHSITEEGVRKAMRERHVNFCDYNLANAAETRHAMDRIFGYLGSSVMRAANQKMRSIGRVQTPALILVCEREDRIVKFIEQHKSTYSIEAQFTFPAPIPRGKAPSFTQAVTIDTEANGRGAGDASSDCDTPEKARRRLTTWQLERSRDFSVVPGSIVTTDSVTPPPKPFTMATLISQANRQLRMSGEMVSNTLQDLFQLGFITYPRTDSTRIDSSALPAIYREVTKDFGKAMLYTAEQRAADEGVSQDVSVAKEPPRKRGASAAKKRKGAVKEEAAAGNVEDAHEAIRPTNIEMDGDALSLNQQAKQLYNLIRKNTVCSFMIPMRAERVAATVTFTSGSGAKLFFKLGGKRVAEPGWTAGYKGAKKEASDDAATAEDEMEGGADEAEATATVGAEEETAFVEKDGVRKAMVQVLSDEEFQAILKLASTLKSGGGSRGGTGAAMLKFPTVTEFRAVPPQPLTEGTLIEELKNNGVGRPSTYPTIVRTLQQRGYMQVNERGRCESTELGRQLVATSAAMFPSLIDLGFTASFEKKLDAIAKPSTQELPAILRGTNLTRADYVLSHFLSVFLTYITEATRLQRTQIVERTMRLRNEQRKEELQNRRGDDDDEEDMDDGSTADSNDEFERVVAEAKAKVAASVPDFLVASRQHHNFTALQKSLYEYLKKNFPPVMLTAAQSGQGVALSEHPIPLPQSSRWTPGDKKQR